MALLVAAELVRRGASGQAYFVLAEVQIGNRVLLVALRGELRLWELGVGRSDGSLFSRWLIRREGVSIGASTWRSVRIQRWHFWLD